MTVSRAIAAVIRAEPDEVGASLTGFAVFFCIFAGYFMLRPVREAMGIAAGVDRLQWLFTATFAATVLVVPLFAWLSSRVPRRAFAGWVYAAFCANLVAFALAFHAWRSEEHTSELQSRENLVCRLLLEKKKERCRLCKYSETR